MLAFALCVLGVLVGGSIGHGVWEALSGGALGVALSARSCSQRLAEQLGKLGDRMRALELQVLYPPIEPKEDHESRSAPERGEAPPQQASARAPVEPPGAAAPPPRPAPAAPPGPDSFQRLLATLRELVLGQNTVVRVGVLVLLVGVLLLAKWAADNDLFPLEARLATAALIGLALTVVGYRVRESRPDFGTSLQGGGIAALYLVVFIAFRFFALLPAGLTFALLVAVAAASGTLSVLQRSQPLVFIGSLGGFVAPLVALRGPYDPVVLFGYYLLLNLAIATVAWFQTWRALNLLAFACTYVVASVWGVLRYRPEHFASTEPFLLAHFVVFTGIAVIFAWRRPPRLAGFVDGTLVFGTALVTLLAQARLVEGVEFGMAWSAAGLGLFYAMLATTLWRLAPHTLRQLSEAFVALAVGFGTLAIPFALDDGLSTSMAWALEGAALYWVGTRQNRQLGRATGVGLQLLAALVFVQGVEQSAHELGDVGLANARFLACAALAFAGLFIARQAYAVRERISRNEWLPLQVLIGWSLCWWLGGALTEIEAFAATRYEVPSAIALVALTALAQERVAQRLAWLPGRLSALWIVPAGFFALAVAALQQPHILAGGGFVAWSLLIGSVYTILLSLEHTEAVWTRLAYAPAFWLAALVLAIAGFGLAEEGAALTGDWPIAAFAFALAAALVAGQRAVEAALGPF